MISVLSLTGKEQPNFLNVNKESRWMNECSTKVFTKKNILGNSGNGNVQKKPPQT